MTLLINSLGRPCPVAFFRAEWNAICVVHAQLLPVTFFFCTRLLTPPQENTFPLCFLSANYWGYSLQFCLFWVNGSSVCTGFALLQHHECEENVTNELSNLCRLFFLSQGKKIFMIGLQVQEQRPISTQNGDGLTLAANAPRTAVRGATAANVRPMPFRLLGWFKHWKRL